MECTKCGKELDKSMNRGGISLDVMGDEYINNYYACAACGWYSMDSYHDRFCGADEVKLIGPITAEEGAAIVALIDACPHPHSKRCDCASHDALYTGRLYPIPPIA